MELIQNNPTSAVKPIQSESGINVKDIMQQIVARWYWFALSIVVIMGIAGIYILSTPPTYTRTASILIKTDSKGKTNSDAGVLGNVDIFQTNTNVNNELVAMQSPAVMYDVVKRLHLDVNYATEGNFYRKVLYGQTLPYKVTFLDLGDNETASFTIRFDGNKMRLTDFVRNGNTENEDKEIPAQVNQPVSTPIGRILIKPTSSAPQTGDQPLYVTRTSLQSATSAYLSRLAVALQGEETSIVDLSFNDVCPQRAEDVLNTLISVYNENWIKDKNQIAVSTSMFISDRLNVIEQELGHVDENISSYKSAHLLPDVQAASSLYMSKSSETSAQILDLNTQLSMAKYIRNYLTTQSNQKQLLPANSGIQNANIEQQISEYNSLLLQRNNLVTNSSEENPLVIDMDHSLKALREAIINSIDNHVITLNTQLSSLERSEQQTTERIAANPRQAKYLLSDERQQKVKEALYLFLLQKREENELSQAFTAYNTRVITPPSGSASPTAPVKTQILLIALIAAIALPTLVIVLINVMNTTVRGKKDLETLDAPIAGEIPAYGKKRHGLFKQKQEETHHIIIKENSRDIINEAFRIVRTNLEFMTGSSDKGTVIMTTSFNPGSGKTFISINLAASLAIKGKKVLAIDLDLRRASLSQYVPHTQTGISNYLAGQENDLSAIITHIGQEKQTFDLIPVGVFPPNPTELLFSKRLSDLIEHVRTQYDYIFIDCPPIDIVADSAIISKLADMTLFVVRAGLMERNMLPEIDKRYHGGKFPKLSVILNGTEATNGRHGNSYSYQYGYGRYDIEN